MNQKGFSLVEIMVTLTIMTILVLGSANVINNQLKSISYLEDRISKLNYEREVRNIFNKADLCKNILAKFNPKAPDPEEIAILDEFKNVYFDPEADQNLYDQLKITQATMKNWNIKGPNTIGELKVQIDIERNRTGGGPQKLKPIDIRIPVRMTSRLQLRECHPTRVPFCGDVLNLDLKSIKKVKDNLKSCCSGGGPTDDCVTTSIQPGLSGQYSVHYICSCT